MANDFTQNPWKLDATGTVTANPVRPARIRVGTSVTLTDINDKVKFVSATAGEDAIFNAPETLFWNGLKVSAISGTVYFYYA